MSNEPGANPTVLFFGTPGSYTRLILDALVKHAIPVVGIVHRTNPGASAPITRLAPRAAVSLPRAGSSAVGLDAIPRFLVRDLEDPAVLAELGQLRPDVIVTGCFPLLIPLPVRLLASRIALNVHPSLLPRHGGPDPIFWTFHAGEHETGVTIHEMDDHFDTGPIIARSHLDLSSESTYESVEAELAVAGGYLLARLLHAPAQPLPESSSMGPASYESRPQLADLVITPQWTIERVTRFIAGCGDSHGPLTHRSGTGAVVRFRAVSTRPDDAQIDLADGVLNVVRVA